MDKLDMFQAIFVKVYAFGWWDFDQIKTNTGIYFTCKDFQGGISVRGVLLVLEATNHKETTV